MSNKSLTLSLVIPVYNEQDYLKACLDAIKRQSEQPDEVIVVDNGCSDKTLLIAKRYGFVKIIKEPRRGVTFARSCGFNAATGDIIGRIDADSILPPHWVAQVKAGLRKPDAAATTGPVSYYDMPFAPTNYLFDHGMRRFIYRLAPKSPFLFGSNMAILGKFWQELSASLCSRQDIHEDIDLAIHLRSKGHKIIYDKALLAGASGRRYNDRLADFGRYMWMYRRTYHIHGLHSPLVYAAMFMWSLGYVLMHPWLRLWYGLYARRKRAASYHRWFVWPRRYQ